MADFTLPPAPPAEEEEREEITAPIKRMYRVVAGDDEDQSCAFDISKEAAVQSELLRTLLATAAIPIAIFAARDRGPNPALTAVPVRCDHSPPRPTSSPVVAGGGRRRFSQ